MLRRKPLRKCDSLDCGFASSRSYERDDKSLHGGVLAKGAAQAGGRLAEKVYNAAGMAAQVRCMCYCRIPNGMLLQPAAALAGSRA